MTTCLRKSRQRHPNSNWSLQAVDTKLLWLCFCWTSYGSHSFHFIHLWKLHHFKQALEQTFKKTWKLTHIPSFLPSAATWSGQERMGVQCELQQAGKSACSSSNRPCSPILYLFVLLLFWKCGLALQTCSPLSGLKHMELSSGPHGPLQCWALMGTSPTWMQTGLHSGTMFLLLFSK